jgi:hypothetical protein
MVPLGYRLPLVANPRRIHCRATFGAARTSAYHHSFSDDRKSNATAIRGMAWGAGRGGAGGRSVSVDTDPMCSSRRS